MPSFLLFSLWAPMVALGDVAVGEYRYGQERPARSALLGLVAAALGIERDDEAGQRALMDGYGVAVRVNASGLPLTDFHTAQSVSTRRNRRWATRRDELAAPGLETILSRRDYRMDAAYTVVLWPRPQAPYPLETVAAALQRPHFTLHVGRKACPLGAPPAPWLHETATLAEALSAYDQHRSLKPASPGEGGAVYADVEAGPWLGAGLVERQRRQRRDAVVSRRGWRFGLREELAAGVAGGAS